MPDVAEVDDVDTDRLQRDVLEFCERAAHLYSILLFGLLCFFAEFVLRVSDARVWYALIWFPLFYFAFLCRREMSNYSAEFTRSILVFLNSPLPPTTEAEAPGIPISPVGSAAERRTLFFACYCFLQLSSRWDRNAVLCRSSNGRNLRVLRAIN